MRVENIDEPGKVGKRAGEAVDLVDHHHIDQSGLDVLEQPFEGRAFEIAAREGRVIILLGQANPAFGSL